MSIKPFLCGLSLLFVVATGARVEAINRLFIENQDIKAGDSGIEILVQMDSDQAVYAVSIALTFNPSHFTVTDVAATGAASGAEWEAGTDFSQID